MKHLIIRHFGPIEEADIELRRVNLIIGPQSSGKSTIMKVACFCDWMERQIELTQNPTKYCDAGFFVRNLLGYHRLEGYMHSDTFIHYENDAVAFEYSELERTCVFKWNESKRWNYKRAKISYIPSERNLVAAIPNWFQVSMNNDNILDFMKEWEFARKAFLEGMGILDQPVRYKYNADDQSDRLLLSNGKELGLTMASSGLQSLTPLFVMLRYLTCEFFRRTHTNVEESMLRGNLASVVEKECSHFSAEVQQRIVDDLLAYHHTDLYIEEPEAHIFPSTQKSFVYALAGMLNEGNKHACFIATHSPYIMTSFNNLILAGESQAESERKASFVEKILTGKKTLRFDEVSAYEIADGKVRSIMDEEFHLISADAIDATSQEIANDFDYLLSL